jgi:hypothetical protein
MVGAPQKPGQYPKSGAVAIAEPTGIEEEIAIKSQAICRDSAEESITIYEAANCGPTGKAEKRPSNKSSLEVDSLGYDSRGFTVATGYPPTWMEPFWCVGA